MGANAILPSTVTETTMMTTTTPSRLEATLPCLQTISPEKKWRIKSKRCVATTPSTELAIAANVDDHKSEAWQSIVMCSRERVQSLSWHLEH
jgi:hypothetical protein